MDQTPVTNVFGPQYTRDASGGAEDNGAYCSASVLRAVALATIVVLVIMLLTHHCASLPARLARRGWIVYYRHGCGYCTKQKKELGGAFRMVVECGAGGRQIGGVSNPPLACGDGQIVGYPFWYNTRTADTRIGLQSRAALKLMAL